MNWFSNSTLGGLLGRFPEIIREVKDRHGLLALICLIIGVALLLIIVSNHDPLLIRASYFFTVVMLGLIGWGVLKMDIDLQRLKSQPGTVAPLTQGPLLDVAIATEGKLKGLPNGPSHSTEKSALSIASSFFNRQVFYASEDKDVSAGLWAIVKTRLAWEQQVMPRLTVYSQLDAQAVRNELLKLQSFHENMLNMPDDIVEHAIMLYSNDKGRFLDEISQNRPIQGFRNRIIGGTQEEQQRNRLLQSLRTALSKMNIETSSIVRPPFQVQIGGE